MLNLFEFPGSKKCVVWEYGQKEKELSVYLQGDLQLMFDALYNMGVIDPVLDMDWTKELESLAQYMENFAQVIGIVNSKQHNLEEMIQALKEFDQKTLSYLAMEVAKEFADFHSRENIH